MAGLEVTAFSPIHHELARELALYPPHLQVERLLARLGLEAGPFSVMRFVRRLERRLDVLIELQALRCPSHVHGGLLTMAPGEFVVTYRRNANPLLRRAIIYHELAHLVLAHPSAALEGGVLDCRDENERAAERLGQAILQRSLGLARRQRLTSLDQRLTSFFG